MLVAGLLGLAVAVLDRGPDVATAIVGHPHPDWFIAGASQYWLIGQSVLAIVGGIGGLLGVFRLLAIGVVAGLIFATPVGLVTGVPALLLLLSALVRLRAFDEFKPQWRGEEPRPPGS